MSLADTVAALQVGQKVRVSLRHEDRPVVGVLRGPNNARHFLTNALFLDVPKAFLVRNPGGSPGWGVRWVEVLPTATTTREEELEVIDALVDEYLTARAAWEQAPASERAGELEKVTAAYTACLDAMAAPFEVAS
jgi:hypothetical protein